MKYIKKLWSKHSRGDTIVEVLVSMAVLSVILAAAYAISTRSLQSGVDSQARGQALSYAQAQLELIKNADNNNNINAYKVNYQFHVNSANGSVVSGADNQSPFTVTDTFDTNASSPTYQSFIIKVTWPGTGGQTNQTVLNYKAHNSFVCDSQLLDITDCPTPPTSTIATSPPQVGSTFAVNCGDGTTCNVAYGAGPYTLTWAATNATSCVASGDWSGNKNVNGGNQSTGTLHSSQSFVLTCTGYDGSQISKTITITVGSPPAPTLNFSASPTSISYNGSSTLTWSSSNTTSCAASGSWGGTRSTSGSASTGSLTSSKSYTLTCYGFESQSIQKSVSVSVAPPPPSSYPPSSYPPSSYPPSSYPPSSYPPSSYPPSSYPPSSYPPSSYCRYCCSFNDSRYQTTYPSFGSIYGLPTPIFGMIIC